MSFRNPFKKKPLPRKTTEQLDRSELSYTIPELCIEPAVVDMGTLDGEVEKVAETIGRKIDASEIDIEGADLIGSCFASCYALHAAQCAEARVKAENWLMGVEVSAATQLVALDEHEKSLAFAEAAPVFEDAAPASAPSLAFEDRHSLFGGPRSVPMAS